MMDQFSEDEARRIFAEAARATPAEAPDRSLSLAELQEIGRAAGLDPDAVAAAAAGLRDAVPDVPMWGKTPLSIRRSRVVPGTLSDEAWADVVVGLRRTFKTQGVAETLGRTRTWTHATGSTGTVLMTRITAEPVVGGTRLTAESGVGAERQVPFVMAAATAGALALTGVLMATTGKFEPGLFAAMVVLMTALTALSYIVSRWGAAQRARTQPAKYDAALDQIAALVSTAAPTEPPVAPLRDAFASATDEQPDSAAAPRRRDRS